MQVNRFVDDRCSTNILLKRWGIRGLYQIVCCFLKLYLYCSCDNGTVHHELRYVFVELMIGISSPLPTIWTFRPTGPTVIRSTQEWSERRPHLLSSSNNARLQWRQARQLISVQHIGIILYYKAQTTDYYTSLSIFNNIQVYLFDVVTIKRILLLL